MSFQTEKSHTKLQMEENWGGGRGAGKREVETDCSASNIKKTNLKTTRGDKTVIY